EVADWTTLEVPFAEAEVPAEAVDAELDRLRETVAELAPVDDRPVQEGDTVVLDILGEGVPPQRDYVTEVGADRLVNEIDDALPGMQRGDTKTVAIQGAESLLSVDVTVKEVQEKVLPEIDDELARSASEFETLEELRSEIESRLLEQLTEELEIRFREAAVDALANASEGGTVETPRGGRTAD